jgi:long-chain acyl-CoA synthetase
MTASYHVALPQRLHHWATTTPDALALREKIRGVWQRTTWAEYERRVMRFALGLQAIGFGRGDRLAIASDDTSEWLVADMAAQSLGGVVVGVYPTNPAPELRYIVHHSRCSFIVCGDQEQVDKVIAATGLEGGLPHIVRIICVDMKGVSGYGDARLMSFEAVSVLGDSSTDAATPGASRETWLKAVADIDPADVSVIVYTSGTTGPPKGVQLHHASMMFTAEAVARRYGLAAHNYSVVCYLPLCHLAERTFSISLHLQTGGVVNFAESIDTVQANVREIAPTLFLGVPRIWEKMQQMVLVKSQMSTRLQRLVFDAAFKRAYDRLTLRNARPLPSGMPAPMGWLERIEYFLLSAAVFRPVARHLGLNRAIVRMCGAAPVSPETLRFFEVLGLPVRQIYGLTEIGMAFSQWDGACASGCVGMPLDGIESRLGDDGEVLMRGPSVFCGYLDDAAGSARVLDAEGWIHSGDICETAPNGELRVVDRKKEIIITSGGKNIAPSEIENALKESIYVKEAIIIGDGRHYLSALIVIDIDTVGNWAQQQRLPYTHYRSLSQLPQVRELVAVEVARVNKQFARVENIRKFEILGKELDHDDGELTATQKVKRSVIEKKYAAEIARLYGGGSTLSEGVPGASGLSGASGESYPHAALAQR